MKTLHYLCLTVIFSCLGANLRAQYVTIPDSAFRVYLTANYPQCMSGNQLDTTCAAVLQDTTLTVDGRDIRDLYGVEFFKALTVLNANINRLTTLPSLPATLRHLSCYENSITGPLQFPSALASINIERNPLGVLSSLPATLQSLACGSCQLNSLLALPAGLTFLTCVNNHLSALPALPDSLQQLTCIVNQLTALPALPAGLTNLLCDYNDLDSLPALPQSLVFLSCFRNNLTALPALPARLNVLDCNNNDLITLPALPAKLKTLSCQTNNLTSLPALPDTMGKLDCSQNPQLHCLPQLTKISTLIFDSAVITCLPNYGVVDNGSPNINNYPLCAPGGSCPVFYTISGTVYADANSDCIQQQPAEANVPYLKVSLLQNGQPTEQTYTAGYGAYSFLTNTGTYTLQVDTTGLPFVVTCPANGVAIANVTNVDSVQQYNFALQCKPGFDIAVQSVSAYDVFRPGSTNLVNIKAGDAARFYRQTCNTLNVSGQLVTTITGPVNYVSPAPGALTPTVAGKVLTYTIADWSALKPDSAFNIITTTDTQLVGLNNACFEVSLTPATDNNTANNTLAFCVAVRNSHDPNEKEVSPPGNIDENGNRSLTYTVRFQNTGNAPAINIYVADTLDSDLDAESFQLLAYSFTPQVSIKGRAVRFTFNNINLPDSLSNEPQSHGFVQYKIKVKPNATPGTAITNTASIYFDFNAPVVTNTTTNTLGLFSGIAAISSSTGTMQVYPNPAQNMVTVTLSDNLTGGTLTLSDVTGRSLNTITVTNATLRLNTSALGSGVYLLTATKGGERIVQRLVVGR